MAVLNLRDARGPVDRAEIHAAIEKLFELRDLTSSEGCPDPDAVQCGERKGKDELASWAVHLANHIVLQLSGWAFNHLIGRVVAADRRQSANSHEHENAGMTFTAGANPKLDRAVLVLLLDNQCRTMPPHLWIQAQDALQALDLGETHPLVRPEVTGRHYRPFSLAKARLQAIEYVHFLIGQGRKRTVAEEMVAGACGVSPHTLRSWEKRDLPQILGKNEVDKATDWARRAGDIHRTLEVDPDSAQAAKGRTESFDGAGYMTRHLLVTKSLSAIGQQCQRLLREDE